MNIIGIGSMGAYLVAAAAVDIKNRRLSRGFLVIGIIPAVLLMLGTDDGSLFDTIAGFVFGLLFMGVAFLSKNRLGVADAVILFYLGGALGFTGVAGVSLIAFVLSAAVVGVLLVLKKISMKGSIPFIPFLLAAYTIVMFLAVGRSGV